MTPGLHDEFEFYCEHFRVPPEAREQLRHAFYFGALKMMQVLRPGALFAREWAQNIDEFLEGPDPCRCDECKQDVENGTAFSAVAFLEEWVDELRV